MMLLQSIPEYDKKEEEVVTGSPEAGIDEMAGLLGL